MGFKVHIFNIQFLYSYIMLDHERDSRPCAKIISRKAVDGGNNATFCDVCIRIAVWLFFIPPWKYTKSGSINGCRQAIKRKYLNSLRSHSPCLKFEPPKQIVFCWDRCVNCYLVKNQRKSKMFSIMCSTCLMMISYILRSDVFSRKISLIDSRPEVSMFCNSHDKTIDPFRLDREKAVRHRYD